MTSDTLAKLELRGVQHRYDDVVAVERLDLAVQAGEVVCLLGPSGCGKTTALRVAAGLEPVADGEVLLDGRVVSAPGRHTPPERRNVGLVFQDYALFPHLSIAENIAFGLEALSGGGRAQRIDEVLKRVGLAGYKDSYPHELSGGQQQRIALARALAPDPAIVLMDEPFSGLDARLRDRVRDKTLHVLKQSGAACLMVTHDAEEAMYMADRIAVMREGRLIQIGTPEELYCNPADAFVAAFFGEVNHIYSAVANGAVETPIGNLRADGFREGEAVDVVVRPEAIQLHPAERTSYGPGYAKVLAARMLGRTSLVHLCTCKTTGEDLHLHARVPGRYLPKEDSIQSVVLDRSQAFVFPAEGAK
ncbi:MAG: ABC transporter ATP-binding protein [Nitratireductor sp.]